MMNRQSGPRKDIYILGAGAIGSVIAAALAEKHAARLLAIGRPAHVQRIQATGLRLKGTINRTVRLEVKETLTTSLEDSLVIVTVKATALENALLEIAPLLRPTTTIMLVQNGYGVKEHAARILQGVPVKPQQILQGIVAIAAGYFLAGEVYYHGGTLRLEPAFEHSRFGDIFTDTFLRVKISRNFEKDLWTKLVVNAVINPLSVILRANNHRLAESSLNDLKKQVLDEALQVAGSEGIHLNMDMPFINRFIDTNNYTSMYQDIVKKRKTEIRFITGALIELAEKHRIEVPVNRFLYNAIRAYENLHCS